MRSSSHQSFLLEGAALPEDFFEEGYSGARVQRFVFDQIGMDAIPMLESEMSLRDTSARIIVIVATDITREAENALLKFFEEPGEGTCVLFVTPKAKLLLPTVRSRFYDLGVLESGAKDDTFLQAMTNDPLPKRLLFIESFVKAIDEPSILRERSREGIVALMRHVRSQKSDPKSAFLLAELSKAYDAIIMRGSSVKMILEHIALCIG